MKNRNIYLLYAIALLQGMVFYGPIATLYRQAVGLSIFEITWIESISLILTVLLEIPWGWAADRIGYRKTMAICCTLFLLSKLIFWQAQTLSGFLVERILLAVVCAGLSGVDSGMLYLSCDPVDSHRVFSVYENLQQAGLVFSAGIYALWIGSDYRLAALLTVASYGAAALSSFGLQEVKMPSMAVSSTWKQSLQVLTGQLRNGKNLLLLLAVALFSQTHQTITVFLNQLQYTRAGMSAEGISLAYILVSFCGLFGGLSAAFCRRIGQRRFAGLLFAVAALSCVVLAATQHLVWSIGAIVGLRISFSLLQPLQMTLQNRLVQGQERATALSMNSVLVSSIGAVLSTAFGRIAEFDLSCAMIFGAALCLMGLLLFQCSKCYV